MNQMLNFDTVTHITETNVAWNDDAYNTLWWNFGDIENAKQIFALSHDPDKFGIWTQFDFESAEWRIFEFCWLLYARCGRPIMNGSIIN